jgi:hypothetical protein
VIQSCSFGFDEYLFDKPLGECEFRECEVSFNGPLSK